MRAMLVLPRGLLGAAPSIDTHKPTKDRTNKPVTAGRLHEAGFPRRFAPRGRRRGEAGRLQAQVLEMKGTGWRSPASVADAPPRRCDYAGACMHACTPRDEGYLPGTRQDCAAGGTDMRGWMDGGAARHGRRQGSGGRAGQAWQGMARHGVMMEGARCPARERLWYPWMRWAPERAGADDGGDGTDGARSCARVSRPVPLLFSNLSSMLFSCASSSSSSCYPVCSARHGGLADQALATK